MLCKRRWWGSKSQGSISQRDTQSPDLERADVNSGCYLLKGAFNSASRIAIGRPASV